MRPLWELCIQTLRRVQSHPPTPPLTHAWKHRLLFKDGRYGLKWRSFEHFLISKGDVVGQRLEAWSDNSTKCLWRD